MPRGFRTWRGAEVEWLGAVVGEVPHGYALACEKWRKGIQLGWDEHTRGVADFEEALDRRRDASGILRVRVRGRLRSDDEGGAVLQLKEVIHVSFEPMSDAEEERYWNGLISLRQGGGGFEHVPTLR